MKFLLNKIKVPEAHMVNNKMQIKATRLAPLFTNVSFVIPLNIKYVITHIVKLLKMLKDKGTTIESKRMN